MKIKNLILFIFLSVFFISCEFVGLSKVNNVARLTKNNLVGMVNPFYNVESLKNAEELAGFPFKVPDSFGKYNIKEAFLQYINFESLVKEII